MSTRQSDIDNIKNKYLQGSSTNIHANPYSTNYENQYKAETTSYNKNSPSENVPEGYTVLKKSTVSPTRVVADSSNSLKQSSTNIPAGARLINGEYMIGSGTREDPLRRLYPEGQKNKTTISKTSYSPKRTITTTVPLSQQVDDQVEHVKRAHHTTTQNNYSPLKLTNNNNYKNNYTSSYQTSYKPYDNDYSNVQKTEIPPKQYETKTYTSYEPVKQSYIQEPSNLKTTYMNYDPSIKESAKVSEIIREHTNHASHNKKEHDIQNNYVPSYHHHEVRQQYLDQDMEVNHIVQELKKQNKQFTDSQFKPTAENIGGYFPNARWKRANQVLPNPQIFVDQIGGGDAAIEPNDIQQGNLGNCYFLSTLAALAENEQNIRELFPLDKSSEEVGLYRAKVCWIGVWEEVIIDNYFPVINNQFCFSHSKEQELWVLILEKIWAKLHGSYCKIDGGLTKEPLHDMTGAPARTFFTSSDPHNPKFDDVWYRIKYGEVKNHMMTCGSIDDETELCRTMEQEHGIAPGHAYSLLSAIEVKIGNQFVRLVKLRNPWSNVEWNGKYGDSDPLWNIVPKDVQQHIGFEGRNDQDGIFFMEYSEFVKYFENVQICYRQDQGVSHGVKFTGTPQGNCFKVNIPTQGVYYYQVSQKSIRTTPFEIQENVPTKKFYSKVSMIVAPEENPLNCLVAVSGNQRDLTSFRYVDGNQSIAPGTYLVYIETHQTQYENSNKMGFSVYGPQEVEIEEVSHESLGDFPAQSKQTSQHPQIEKY